MKVKAKKNFFYKGKTYLMNDELEISKEDNILLNNDFVVCLDKPEVIAEQSKLDSPAFGLAEQKDKITNKVKNTNAKRRN